MKTTVEIPDDLMVEVKIEAAKRRKKLKELVPELVRAGLKSQQEAGKQRRPMTSEEAAAWMARMKAIGADIQRHSVDPRTLVEILDEDRR